MVMRARRCAKNGAAMGSKRSFVFWVDKLISDGVERFVVNLGVVFPEGSGQTFSEPLHIGERLGVDFLFFCVRFWTYLGC